MPLECTHDDCDGATSLDDIADRKHGGVTEFYECEFGHRFSVRVGAE